LHAKKQSRLSSAIFTAKAALLRGVRAVSNLRQPVRQLRHADRELYPVLLAECRSHLWTTESLVENSLQFGKVQNLRKACVRLHNVEVPAGVTFSFWKQVGKAKISKGYALGRELRQGCLIPSVGGGLCQLSNSLYDLALQSDCEIIERHAHTAVVPGSAAEQGRDATIFWNYVDFRFQPKQDIRITAVLNKNELVLSFWGKHRLLPIRSQQSESRPSSSVVNTCMGCGVSGCFRHIPSDFSKSLGRAAFLIEECWPEFEDFAAQTRSEADDLFLPFHSSFKNATRYKWNREGYRRTVAANLPTIFSAAKVRFHLNGRVPPVASQVARSEALADYYGARLSTDTSHVYVAQSLLPFLWRRGDLGGRTFSVLMTRLPLRALHDQLDALAARFPERKTFREFRALAWMPQDEAEALDQAEQIITPHSMLASVFPLKAKFLDWKQPQVKSNRPGSHIVFPGPSLARKGAFELRDAVQHLDYPLMVLNGVAESERFWDGVRLTSASNEWLSEAAMVVQPAFVENNPRPLLRALAAGVPVIATPECGIAEHPLLTLVPAGDAITLREAIEINIRRSVPLGATRS
jgi:hypothetical protein